MTSQTNVVVDTVDRTNTSNWSNLDYRITLRFRWDIPAGDEFNAAATNDVYALVSEDMAPASSVSDTRTMNYGVCASIRVLNFAQDGVAADGRINPWFTAFNVTGAIVYYVAGESITNKVVTVDPGPPNEISGTTLLMDGGVTAYTDNNMADDLSYTVGPGTGVLVLGNHAWRVRATMDTAPGTEDTVATNQLAFNCDQVEITAVTFTGGGGINAPSYYRSVNIAGTQINVTARMQDGLGAMVGNTVIRFSDGTNNYDVPILDGQNSGSLLLNPYPGVGITPDTQTTPLTYSAVLVTGGAYDGEQSGAGNIGQPGPYSIYWDRNDPPGDNSVAFFTAWGGYSATATSITLNWSPLTAVAPDLDADFYTYRIYYRESGSTSFTMLDRTTDASLGLIGTNTFDLTGLKSLTNYDYYITAMDVFGQEVQPTNSLYEPPQNGSNFNTISTIATTYTVSITDGVTEYQDATFTADKLASARPMMKSSIRVNVFLVAAEGQPDSMNVILAKDNPADLVSGGVLAGVEGTDYFKISCVKAAPNKWSAQVADTNPLIAMGNSLRFILETKKSGITAYADHDSDYDVTEDPNSPFFIAADPNDYEWTFNISKATTFTPWPTRILNNVITDRNPLAYPSFYLTDDAYVTIKAYDIKGRAMATLLDS
ncbi:MAG TPA: fibronectin type III domain-containing protein, partial [Spirochaetota bacterium]|nr:fibronectin type III domain-containing protein [Spirochaetota bacterium]